MLLFLAGLISFALTFAIRYPFWCAGLDDGGPLSFLFAFIMVIEMAAIALGFIFWMVESVRLFVIAPIRDFIRNA